MASSSPLKAIRAYCLGCSCGSANEVKLCPIARCELYPFRFGHNPNMYISDEEKQRRKDLAIKNNALYWQKNTERIQIGNPSFETINSKNPHINAIENSVKTILEGK